MFYYFCNILNETKVSEVKVEVKMGVKKDNTKIGGGIQNYRPAQGA